MNNRPKNGQAPANGSRPHPLGCDSNGCIDSRCLLAGTGQCWICHQGQRYQLRVTAANKLILTK